MSVHDDLTSVQRSLDDLQRSVRRLEQQMGAGLEMRRVRADADHLRESVALLRDATGPSPGAPPGPDRRCPRPAGCPTWCPSPTPRTTAPCGPIPTTRVSAPITVPPTERRAPDTGAPPNPTGVRSWPLVRNLI